MQNNLIFESNDIESINIKYNLSSNPDSIIQKIFKYSDLETIKNIIDEKKIRKNINNYFSIICKRTNNELSEYFYKKYEEIINNNVDNVFKMLCISKNKSLIMEYYNKNKKKINSDIITSSFFSLKEILLGLLVLSELIIFVCEFSIFFCLSTISSFL